MRTSLKDQAGPTEVVSVVRQIEAALQHRLYLVGHAGVNAMANQERNLI